MTDTPQVLDVDQVAALLRCEPATVRGRALDLGGIKLGRDWVFPAGALARRLDDLALANGRRAAPPAPAAVLQKAPAPQRKGRRGLPTLPSLSGP